MRISLVNAGHPAPFVTGADQQVRRIGLPQLLLGRDGQGRLRRRGARPRARRAAGRADRRRARAPRRRPDARRQRRRRRARAGSATCRPRRSPSGCAGSWSTSPTRRRATTSRSSRSASDSDRPRPPRGQAASRGRGTAYGHGTDRPRWTARAAAVQITDSQVLHRRQVQADVLTVGIGRPLAEDADVHTPKSAQPGISDMFPPEDGGRLDRMIFVTPASMRSPLVGSMPSAVLQHRHVAVVQRGDQADHHQEEEGVRRRRSALAVGAEQPVRHEHDHDVEGEPSPNSAKADSMLHAASGPHSVIAGVDDDHDRRHR